LRKSKSIKDRSGEELVPERREDGDWHQQDAQRAILDRLCNRRLGHEERREREEYFSVPASADGQKLLAQSPIESGNRQAGSLPKAATGRLAACYVTRPP
jgi:hypothetical protein